MLDFGWAKKGDIIIVSDVVIEETECPEPPTYYLVGSMTEWAALKEYIFVANEEAAGEFMLNTTLAVGDAIKVVGISEGNETWYPNGIGNEYVVDAAHAGETIVYFRPDGNADWKDFGGYIFIPGNGQGVEQISQEKANSQKLIRNGQLYIRQNGKTYSVIGQEVK